jgi:L-alanine-DL-glutamate epimerase-like enolase superfamily enzyme
LFHFPPKAVEPFDLLWLETDLFEPKALSLIRQSTTTPIGSLETILGRRNLKPYLENYAVDVAIIDAQWNGLVEATRMVQTPVRADCCSRRRSISCRAGARPRL